MKQRAWFTVYTNVTTVMFVILSMLLACKSSKLSSVDNSKVKDYKTQVILKTQNFAFDPNDINKVGGPFVNQTKLDIPKNLVGQNKWIMFEGPVLENDLIAYRYYADGRHRYDIYGKKVHDLVMDTVSWQYHDIMDWGSDILKVGNSLGMGSPAIWYKDSLYTLSNWDKKIVSIKENKGNRSSVITEFIGLNIADKTFDVVEEWSLEAGHLWSEINLSVKGGSLPKGMYFATGIVKHLDELIEGKSNNARYAYTWGEQSFHHQNMGMAVSFSNDLKPKMIENKFSHVYIFKNGGNKAKYRFMAAWEKDISGIKDAGSFEKAVIGSCIYTNK